MRVLPSKLCPSAACFPKPCPGVYSPPVLQLEDGQHALASPSRAAGAAPEKPLGGDEGKGVGKKRFLVGRDAERGAVDGKSEEDERLGGVRDGHVKSKDVKTGTFVKSSLKKPREPGSKNFKKGRVKWMDFQGKDLVHVREFEMSDSEDSDSEGSYHKSCACVIQ